MTPSVREALARGASLLPRRSGLPDPGHEARWLLAHAWGVSETWLRIHADARVPADVETRFGEWLARRAAGEPAHHLTGSCTFCGRSFEVSPAVLVPRPETELVAEIAADLPISPGARVLDVGTGSGCLAVTLAAQRPRWRVTAVDRSLDALAVARRNVASHAVDVTLVAGNLASAVAPPWDLVVANLPYIPTGALDLLPLEVRREPRMALDGGGDGLELVRAMLVDLPRLLRPCGGAVLELGEDQAAAVSNECARLGLGVARRVLDLGGCERVVVLERRQ